MSEWADLGGGQARLVAQIDPETNLLSGMVEIRLDEGWKTYWRTPGSSGIPPIFDFSRSTGAMVGNIAFPVPRKLQASGSHFTGYEGRVAFLFDGFAAGSRPALQLDLLAGVCRDICIPATATLAIDAQMLAKPDPRAATEIELARAHLPGLPTTQFGVTGIETGGNDKYAILANLPGDAARPKLFLEASDGSYLPYPEAVRAGDGTYRFLIDRQVLDKAASAGGIRYTLSSGDEGVEGRLPAAQ